MLSEDLCPWLLEINACPGMAPSSVEKARLCAAVIEDTIKGNLDKIISTNTFDKNIHKDTNIYTCM